LPYYLAIAPENTMFKKLFAKEEVPQAVANQLAEMMFSAPSAILLYVIGLIIAAPVFWWRSHDFWIAAAAVTGILLNLSRVAVVRFFKSRNRDGNWAGSRTYWTLIFALGSCFSPTLAVLVARAFFVGDMISVALAVMLASGYLMGVIVRASAVPEVAIPHLLLFFGPLIVLAACVPDRGFLVVALLLGFFCAACFELSLSVHRRIRAQLLAEHQLALLARTDHLTGLANRASFDAHGRRLLQRAHSNQCGYAIALVDLDGFKAVNDTYGHAAGDELLKEVAARIKTALGGGHFPTRIGGDEFAVVFDPDTKLDDVISLANQIVGSLKRPFRIAGSIQQISGSVGIARLEGPGDTFSSIVERADKALYQAKHAGRNQAQVLVMPDWSPSIVPEANSVTLVDELGVPA
jgi:diguanylate cyclase